MGRLASISLDWKTNGIPTPNAHRRSSVYMHQKILRSFLSSMDPSGEPLKVADWCNPSSRHHRAGIPIILHAFNMVSKYPIEIH